MYASGVIFHCDFQATKGVKTPESMYELDAVRWRAEKDV